MPSIFDIPAKGQGAQINMLGTPATDIHSLIDEISMAEGVDPKLIHAIVQTESGYDPNAKATTSTASGLMQLVKGTAQQMGVTNVFDPRENLTGGIRYLKQHLGATGGDVTKSLAMYNQGPAGDLNKAQDYVAKVQKFYGGNFAPTQGKPQIDMGSLVSQYGIDPYPVNESKSLSIPQVPPISPDTSELYKVVDEGPVGRGFSQALSTPSPQVGKLPFGVENKGGRISQVAKDVLYGLPEGVMNLAAGLVGMPAAAIGGTAKAMTSGLEAGGDTFNEIAATSMGHPQTATAQLMMKPFEVIFGGILNSGAEVVKDLNPNATPEELDSKVKATQFVMNLAMVAPMFKGAVKGRGRVDAENPAKSLDAHEVTPEVVEGAKAQVMADPSVAPEVKAQVEGIDVGVLQSIQKKAAKSVAQERAQAKGVPTAKFPENQSIVGGLMTEAELRDDANGRGTLRKAANIVAGLEEDAALVDFKPVKGIRVNGTTGKAIARLIEEREAARDKILDEYKPKINEVGPEVTWELNEYRFKPSSAQIKGNVYKTYPLTKDLYDVYFKGPEGKEYSEYIEWFNNNPDLVGEGKPVATLVGKKGEDWQSFQIRSDKYTDEYFNARKEYFEDSKPKSTGDDVPMDVGEVGGPVKSLEEIPAKGEEKPFDLPPPPETPPEGSIISDNPPKQDFQSIAESIDPSIKYDGKMAGIPEAGIPDIHNFTFKLENGEEPSFSVGGEVTPERVAEEVKKVRDKFEAKVEEPPVETTVGEASPIASILEDVKKKLKAEEGNVAEYVPVDLKEFKPGQPITVHHYSRTPFEVGKLPQGADGADNVYGVGFYGSFPEHADGWANMDRYVPGDFKNEITITPKNPLVLTPESVKTLLKGKNLKSESNPYGHIDTWVKEYAEANGHDAIVVKGFFDNNKLNSINNEYFDEFAKYADMYGPGKLSLEETNAIVDRELSKWSQERLGVDIDVARYMFEFQDQVYVDPRHSNIIKPSKLDPMKFSDREVELNALSDKIAGKLDKLWNSKGERTPEIEARIDKLLESLEPITEELATLREKRLKREVDTPIISEFDSISRAKDEGYTFPDKDRYQSPEKAQAKAVELGDGHEVIKVGKTYKVAKYVEEVSYPEFKSEAEANAAGFDVLSEIKPDKVNFYQPEEGGLSPVKIGDKHYRTTEFKEMPDKIMPEEVAEVVKEKWEDGVSPDDYQALLAFSDATSMAELRLRDKLEQLKLDKQVEELFQKGEDTGETPTVKSGVGGREVNPELFDALKAWKDSYVTKCNVAQELPVTQDYYTLYHGNSKKLISSKDMSEGHRGYFATEDLKVAKKFGENIHEVKISKDSVFDPRDPSMLNQFVEAYKKYRVIDNEIRFKQIAQSGNFSLFERPASKHALEDLGYKGNWQVEDGASVIRVFKKEDFNIQSKKTPKKPITKESLAPFDDNFKTFKNIEDAKEWMEATGAVGELIPDPLTGKVSFINTEKLKGLDELDLYDEGIEQLTGHSDRGLEDWDNPNVDLSDTGTRDLFDIFNNERGSVDVTPLRVAADAIIDTMEKAKKMGKSIDEYLAHIGADEAAIATFKGAMARLPIIQQQIREKDPNLSKILHPEEPLAAPQTVKRNKNKEIVWTMPGITESVAKSLVEAPKDALHGKTVEFVDPSTGKLSVHFNANSFQRLLNSFRNPIYTLRSAGLGWVRHMERELRSQAKKAGEEWVDWSQSLKAQIDPARLNNYYVASWERMKGAKEALDAMGIKAAAPLNALEIKIKREIATKLDMMLDQINYSRTRSGQKAIPRLKDLDGNINYLPLIRAINQLADKGMLEGLTTMPLSKLSQMTNNFKGTFNPHALKRGNSGIPIELDVFAALEKYGTYGFKDIYMSPMAALLHEMATKKLNIPGQKVKMNMMEWNPGLGKFLANYSETILGKDPVLAALMAKHEWVGQALHGSDAIGVRMIAAILGGSVRTTVIQPSMYLPNTIGHLNIASAGHGILQSIADIGKGKDSRYWKESSIANLRDYGNDAAYVKELLDRGFLQGARKKTVEISMIPTKIFDHAVAEATWNAGIFHAEKKLKLKGQDAVRFADDFVEMAQGLPTKGSKAPVETSAATRIFTILQSFGIADFNFIASNILGVKNPEANIKSTVFKVIKYTAALQLVGELYKWAGFENVAPDPIGAFQEAQDEGKGMAASLGMGVLEFAEKVPILSNVKYGANLGGPVAEMGDMIPEAAKAAINLLDWGHMTEKQRFHQMTTAARTIGYWYGIPMTNQILKSIKSAYKGGSPYEIIIGVYEKEKKKKGGLRPNVPRPPQPPRPF